MEVNYLIPCICLLTVLIGIGRECNKYGSGPSFHKLEPLRHLVRNVFRKSAYALSANKNTTNISNLLALHLIWQWFSIPLDSNILTLLDFRFGEFVKNMC